MYIAGLLHTVEQLYKKFKVHVHVITVEFHVCNCNVHVMVMLIYGCHKKFWLNAEKKHSQC